MTNEKLSPRDFLRARRPERFSDSIVIEESALDRSLLEYHLDTLTNRKQEMQFEKFAHALAEREVCPNLLPQTGPMGGGDSKVDAETYPVADSLCFAWYQGIGREAASERWAFAFSTKKKWRDKLREDIKKIISTGRPYKKIFFVSNQFIRSKGRANIEDQIKAEHQIDLRILDKTWILDKIFANGNQNFAIEKLELSTDIRKKIRKGPLDTERENDLIDVEGRIREATQKELFSLALVEDCIEAADLARGLELTRTEVDGRYDRAERIALKCGTRHQRLQCAYQRAWTAYWWYEDFNELSRLYDAVEDRAKGSLSSYDLELLTNIWTLLHSAVSNGRLEPIPAAYDRRTESLNKELTRVAHEQKNTSISLHAKTLSLQVALIRKLTLKQPIDHILRSMKDVIRSSEGLVGYPLEPLLKILSELQENLEESHEGDELFETIVEIASLRKSDIVGARMLLRRGRKRLAADHPYEAIQSLGLALTKLYKHESRIDLVRALYICGCAYERVGLLWAARGTLMVAASVAMSELWMYGEVTYYQGACYNRLKWIELQLGRLAQLLSFHEADSLIRRILLDKGDAEASLPRGETEFDLLVGLLILRTDLWELKYLTKLPDVLQNLGLPSAAVALLFALGYEEEIKSKSYYDTWGDEDPLTVFLKWRDNEPANEELPPKLQFYEERDVFLTSNILGCEFEIKAQNIWPCLELAESLIAALESLLSTGTIGEIASVEPKLIVRIRKSGYAAQPFEYKIEGHAPPILEVDCADFDPHEMSQETQGAIKEKLGDVLATLLARLFMMKDVESVLDQLLGKELALDRAIGFTGSFVTSANILGAEPKNSVSRWPAAGTRDYVLRRSEPWDAGRPYTQSGYTQDRQSTRPGKAATPPEFLDRSRTKHSEIQTISLISIPLWDEAEWFATAVGWAPGNSAAPILALGFRNAAAGKQIFSNWLNQLGSIDEKEQLRVSIIRNYDKNHPFWYRVAIGSLPPDGLIRKGVRYTHIVSRIIAMNAESNLNLQKFITAYRKFNFYFLTQAGGIEEVGQRGGLRLDLQRSIRKKTIYIREAWEIGENDPDSVAIFGEDTPIIPTEQQNAPVLALLQSKSRREANSAD